MRNNTFAILARLIVTALTITVCTVDEVRAAIVNTTGAIKIVSPPPDVSLGERQSDTEVIAFPEQQNLKLKKPLVTDISIPGPYSASESPDLSVGAIPKNTIVNSYYLHADSISGHGNVSVVFDGTIEFSEEVLGIDVLSKTLDSGLDLLGSPTTWYPFSAANSDLEFDNGVGRDRLVLSPDRKTVTIQLHNVGNTDQLRIITAIPEASTFLLSALACSGLMALSCRRRRQAMIKA